MGGPGRDWGIQRIPSKLRALNPRYYPGEERVPTRRAFSYQARQLAARARGGGARGVHSEIAFAAGSRVLAPAAGTRGELIG